MSFADWLSLFAISILGAASPGPSLAVVVKNTLGADKLTGFVTSWAHALGIGVYAILTVFGLTIILKQTPWLFNIITYAGALYLAWLGYKALSSKGGIASKLEKGEKISLVEAARDGVIISLFNPKIALFFIALFSQFIHEDMDFTGKLITTVTPFLTDGLWYSFIVLILSHSKILEFLRQKASLIDKLTGIVFILIAFRIVIS